ncbi:MAG: AraC family transcriptional regulator, partial [Rhabdochlamydiaceae bacterium]
LWFDNMQDRPIKGATGWKDYQISFDIPKNSTTLSFGVLLVGEGSVWINDATLIEVNGSEQKSIDDLDIDLVF